MCEMVVDRCQHYDIRCNDGVNDHDTTRVWIITTSFITLAACSAHTTRDCLLACTSSRDSSLIPSKQLWAAGSKGCRRQHVINAIAGKCLPAMSHKIKNEGTWGTQKGHTITDSADLARKIVNLVRMEGHQASRDAKQCLSSTEFCNSG